MYATAILWHLVRKHSGCVIKIQTLSKSTRYPSMRIHKTVSARNLKSFTSPACCRGWCVQTMENFFFLFRISSLFSAADPSPCRLWACLVFSFSPSRGFRAGRYSATPMAESPRSAAAWPPITEVRVRRHPAPTSCKQIPQCSAPRTGSKVTSMTLRASFDLF